MSDSDKHPRVGVGVLVMRNGQLLLGERIGSHGSDTWCPPGGHLEFGETPAECAARELLEETGLHAQDIHAGPWTNDLFEVEGKHYLTVFMMVSRFTGEPTVMEPDKCARWRWFDFNALPEPLFPSVRHLLEFRSLEQLAACP